MRSLWLVSLVLACGGAPAGEAPPDVAVPITPMGARLPGIPEARVFRIELARAALSFRDVNGRSLDRLRREQRASLVINAGFFDPAFAPVGLVIDAGRELSPLAPTLSGGVLAVTGSRGELWAAEVWAAQAHAPLEAPRFAVQCRPRLVVDGARNVDTDTGLAARRTALCVRDAGGTLDVVIVPTEVTLYALGDALVAHGCRDALNLDGGPSTGVAWRDPSGAAALEPVGPVRQAIVVHLTGGAAPSDDGEEQSASLGATRPRHSRALRAQPQAASAKAPGATLSVAGTTG